MTETTQTNYTAPAEGRKWPVWLMAWMAFILILCGIVTVCAPSVYWKFMDIILWIVLVLAWTSWIINSFTNKKEHWWCLLSIIWVLAIILWIIVMCTRTEFIWTLSIWAIAIWALLRWIILVYFSLTNKEQQRFWRWILTLWILLIILFFVIAFSDKEEARAIVWICIWVSTILDWVCLLFLSFMANDDPSLQDKILEQANQSEIANTTTDQPTPNAVPAQPAVAVPTPQPSVEVPVPQPTAEVSVPQPTAEVSVPQPTVEVPVPQPTVEVPVPQPTVEVPNVEIPSTPVINQQNSSEVQPGAIQQPAVPNVQAPVEEDKPAEEAQAPVEENKPAA